MGMRRKKPSLSKRKRKAMAERTLLQKEPNVNRNAKDSVFCDLFGRQEYLMQLYGVLHPEDKKATEDDLTIVTLSSVFLKGIYNDLGFMRGNTLIVLVEEQSTFSYNIIVRILIYIAETYRRYIDRNGLDEYSTTTMELPRPEFYMVFTGERKEHPETISFRKDIPGMEGCPVDVEVKVIYESAKGDILSQYIEFSKIFTEQYKLYGKTQKTIDETLRICRERNILNDYLKKEGVSTIMYKFMDQKTAMRKALRTERQEGKEEGLKEGKKEGLKEGKKEGLLNALAGLVEDGVLTISEAASRAKITQAEFQAEMAALGSRK